DIIIDQGPQARSLRLNLPKFTLIGATTRAGMVSAPLRSRFGMSARLDYYNAEEMQKIIIRSARLLGVEIEPAGAAEIATRTRGKVAARRRMRIASSGSSRPPARKTSCSVNDVARRNSG